MNLTALAGCRAVADRNNGSSFLDQAVDGKCRASLEILVRDLGIERVLAFEVPVARQVPNDIVGEAGEDHVMVAPPEPLEIAFDNLLERRHAACSVAACEWPGDRHSAACASST
jgi:hypothetical protein